MIRKAFYSYGEAMEFAEGIPDQNYKIVSIKCPYEDATGYPTHAVQYAIGTTVAMREINGYSDSDFLAVFHMVGDLTTFTETTYASTRGWTYENSATVDASPEAIEAYREKLDAHSHALRELRRAENPQRGDMVRLKGGKNKGIEGEVFWIGMDKFKPYISKPSRAGVKTSTGETYWTQLSNLKILERVEDRAAKKAA